MISPGSNSAVRRCHRRRLFRASAPKPAWCRSRRVRALKARQFDVTTRSASCVLTCSADLSQPDRPLVVGFHHAHQCGGVAPCRAPSGGGQAQRQKFALLQRGTSAGQRRRRRRARASGVRIILPMPLASEPGSAISMRLPGQAGPDGAFWDLMPATSADSAFVSTARRRSSPAPAAGSPRRALALAAAGAS